MKRNKKRRYMTLIEIMVVMFLIATIGGLITFKIKDSMEYGKAFKTHQNITMLKQALEMASLRKKIDRNNFNPDEILRKSVIAGDFEKVIKDGWGDTIEISLNDDNTIKVTSEKYEQYLLDHDVWFDEE